MDMKSAWASKINWTQAVGLIAMILTVFGIEIPNEVKVNVVAVITGATTVVTWVLRTWFTTKLTHASESRM